MGTDLYLKDHILELRIKYIQAMYLYCLDCVDTLILSAPGKIFLVRCPKATQVGRGRVNTFLTERKIRQDGSSSFHHKADKETDAEHESGRHHLTQYRAYCF